MKMNTMHNFEVMKQFLGYGDLKTARIVFLGIEEGGTDWSPEKLKKNHPGKTVDEAVLLRVKLREPTFMIRSQWTIDHPPWQRATYRVTNRRQAYLSLIVQQSLDPDEGAVRKLDKALVKDYYINNFCDKLEFQANVFPLSARRENQWHREYQEWFGVNQLKEDYMKDFMQERLRLLHEKLVLKLERSYSLSFMFVMGKKLWANGGALRDLKAALFPGTIFKVLTKDRILFGERGSLKVFLTPHPSGPKGLSDTEIDKIRLNLK
jgi:hypothetical protein